MTATDDLDRRIAAFFEDPPVRAPERTIDAVLAHARAHPRRRDPFAVLHRDPMAGGTGGGGRLASMPLVAAVALLVAAGLGGAAVGGLFDRGPSVVGPATSPSPLPSGLGTPLPTIGPMPVLTVDLVESYGADASIEIADVSQSVVSAESGQPGDGGSVAVGTVEVTADPADPTTIVLTWSGTPCDTTHRLTIDGDGRTMELSRPRCEGDSIPRDLVLRLRYGAPVRADEVTVTLVETAG